MEFSEFIKKDEEVLKHRQAILKEMEPLAADCMAQETSGPISYKDKCKDREKWQELLKHLEEADRQHNELVGEYFGINK